MKRRFLVSVSGLSDSETNQLREYLRKGFAWWNWIPNFWLLTTSSDSLTCEIIRDKIHEISSSSECLVMEIPGDIDWAYRGSANKQGKTMGEWLQTTWAEKD